ncbi:MAG: SOS response-associated peptidase family protein [Bdellovibrionales bacterium]|nr:SOS response-associated peptidase family protein [Bdellovibrionales bacterium]
MCYSALVTQNAKDLGLAFDARIQLQQFDDLFTARLNGYGAKIPRGIEASFLERPTSLVELNIAKNIRAYHQLELAQLEKELLENEDRLAGAERSLMAKVTKKAQNDQRIALGKMERLKVKIDVLRSGSISETDSRIYPGHYASLVYQKDGQRWVAPFRYLLRPKGFQEDFDKKYSGCYNARRDNLGGSFWKPIFGRNHGVFQMKSFWENVKRTVDGTESKNVVLRFDPQDSDRMIVPCIFDLNTEGKFPLWSFALITDEPNPEVAAAGHDRTPIILKPENLERWLKTPETDLNLFQAVLEDKKSTFFQHVVAA